jgi:hypothetical protein
MRGIGNLCNLCNLWIKDLENMKMRDAWMWMALAAGLCLCGGAWAQQPGLLHWKGYDWQVKAGKGMGPGNNRWKADNVSVDKEGNLHLKITHDQDGWACAEIDGVTRLGFGTYTFLVEGPIDRMDRNVVLGLFNYGPPEPGPDGTNEIDIEFARWGIADAPALNWTVYPENTKGVKVSATAPLHLDGTHTTNRFRWTRDSVAFTLQGGFQTDGSQNLLQTWETRTTTAHNVPQAKMPVCINLWLFDGRPPKDGSPVEIIIHDFAWQP